LLPIPHKKIITTPNIYLADFSSTIYFLSLWPYHTVVLIYTTVWYFISNKILLANILECTYMVIEWE
jgi:hypothetical protein